MTEFELFEALRPLYPAREYALLPQCAAATGVNASRHADALAVGLWPSRGLYLSGFEIKTYRNDWLREKKNPEKAEDLHRFCNYWWIVTAAAGIVNEFELPNNWGLLAWNEQKKKLETRKPAAFVEARQPVTLDFFCAVLRKAQEVTAPAAAIAAARLEGYEQGKAEKVAERDYRIIHLEELDAKVKEFEAASGIEIRHGWEGAGNIGRAVRAVLENKEARDRETLLSIARRIIEELSAPGQSGQPGNDFGHGATSQTESDQIPARRGRRCRVPVAEPGQQEQHEPEDKQKHDQNGNECSHARVDSPDGEL